MSPAITGSRTALSADQINNILQQSPDLVVELKAQLADRMQQQGVQIDPNEISDEMLYNQIGRTLTCVQVSQPCCVPADM